MKRIIKSLVIAASIAAVSVTSISTAQAHDIRVKHIHKKHGHNWQGQRRHVQKRHNGNDAVVWGIIGLAAGAVIAGSLANQHSSPPRVIRQKPHKPRINHFPAAPRHTYRQKRHYKHTQQARGYQPWTQSWYNYCENKYRSFNPNTGTYRGYDHRDHFCVVR